MTEGSGEVSRRRFLQLAGAFSLIGAAKMSGGDSLARILTLGAGQSKEPSPSFRPASRAGGEPGAPPKPFSIFWVTDTQYLPETNPALFSQMTSWIADNWEAYNGKMVIHTGDIVQTGSSSNEWSCANYAMSTLLNQGIPYTWCAGNHDDLVAGDPNPMWIGSDFEAFNPAVVSDRVNSVDYAYWVGDYRKGMNTAVSFAANGLNFLVINIEWNGPPDVIEWVRNILADTKYADYHAIICPHAYIDQNGTVNDPRWGDTLAAFLQSLTELMDDYSSSVFLTLNGHFATDSGRHVRDPASQREELMFDRQESTDDPDDPFDPYTDDSNKRGGATVTILTFDTNKNQIIVKTYDTYLGEFRDGPNDQYTVQMFSDAQWQEPSLAAPVIRS